MKASAHPKVKSSTGFKVALLISCQRHRSDLPKPGPSKCDLDVIDLTDECPSKQPRHTSFIDGSDMSWLKQEIYGIGHKIRGLSGEMDRMRGEIIRL